MPFSVIVSLSETTLAGMIYDCFSTIGNCGASNELHIVLFAWVFPSYNSTVAVRKWKQNIGWCQIKFVWLIESSGSTSLLSSSSSRWVELSICVLTNCNRNFFPSQTTRCCYHCLITKTVSYSFQSGELCRCNMNKRANFLNAPCEPDL